MLLPRALVRMFSAWVRWTYPFASIGSDVEVHYTLELPRYLAHRVRIGNAVRIGKDVQLGVSCADRLERGEPVITIDDGCVIARRSQISARNGVHLERDVILSASVLIMDHNHAFDDPARPIKHQGISGTGKIRIGEGSWIGHGAALVCTSGDVTLGRNCVVAANALVTRSAPANSVLAGNPARIVRQFDPNKQSWKWPADPVQFQSSR
jgi:acetyltransferase-like isoleucine patch superfamily enzyme